MNDDDRRHVQDDAASLPHHHGHRRLAAQVHALDVDAIQAVELVFGRALDVADVRNAGIINQNVEAPRAPDNPIERRFHARRHRRRRTPRHPRCRPPRLSPPPCPPQPGRRDRARRRAHPEPPKSVEIARPMPEPPPVTTATFPLRLNTMSQAWKYYTLQLKSTISVYFIGKVSVLRRQALVDVDRVGAQG